MNADEVRRALIKMMQRERGFRFEVLKESVKLIDVITSKEALKPVWRYGIEDKSIDTVVCANCGHTLGGRQNKDGTYGGDKFCRNCGSRVAWKGFQ